jgi:hypothetical protein
LINVFEDGRLIFNNRPARFPYTPSPGVASVRFERMINGVKADDVSAVVDPLPRPNIKIIEDSDDEAIVEVTVYGGVESSCVLVVAAGNGREKEIPNSRVADAKFGTVKKRWKVVRTDPTQPFAVELHAWDQRGRALRQILSYSGD